MGIIYVEHRLGNYFCKLDKREWGKTIWVGSGVYQVYLGIFWEFFYVGKMDF
jgi:hypothetical protein